jgi:CubicO group peptidase (beta-lactamase class C family)
MLVVGLFAVLSWDATFPNRRDVMVLAPLPVPAQTMFLAKVAAVGTALALTVALLHGAMGLFWPAAFARLAVPVTVPKLTFDPTPTPVSAANLKTVLDNDLQEMLTHGALAPGTGAGLAIGIYKHGEARAFAYGAAKPDSLFEIGSITKTFTGLMLAQMVVQHRVTLDEPIRLLLPPELQIKPRRAEITLADLATHHAELPHDGPGRLARLSRGPRRGQAGPHDIFLQ